MPLQANAARNTAAWFDDGGDRQLAVAWTERAIPILRSLAEGDPDQFLPAFGWELHLYAIRLGEIRRTAEGLTAAEEAAAILRVLERESPGEYTADLATVLVTLADRQTDAGRVRDGIRTLRESLRLAKAGRKARRGKGS